MSTILITTAKTLASAAFYAAIAFAGVMAGKAYKDKKSK